jgi:hypothetical protein
MKAFGQKPRMVLGRYKGIMKLSAIPEQEIPV